MTTVADIARFLDDFAPSSLAAEWDNVGLLVGDAQAHVRRVMTCLTITDASVAEAVREGANLIVTHHPLPFRPLRRLTTDTAEGRALWALARASIAVYSPHTAFDSARRGINERLSERLGLVDVTPLVESDEPGGTGRRGRLAPPLRLASLAERLKQALAIDGLHAIGAAEREVRQVGVACGSAGELLSTALAAGCDCFVTGELRFHDALAVESAGATALVVGHFASERFGVEELAGDLQAAFSDLSIWASRDERDPLVWR